jgi:hypothetical protein
MPRSLVPEYEQAAHELFMKAVNVFMRAQNPVLEGTREEQVSHLPQESAPREVAFGDSHSLEPVEFKGVLKQEHVFEVNAEEWRIAAWNAADSALNDLMPQVYASMNKIADRNGMIASGRAEGFSWDHVIDGLEKMSLSFDDNGKVDLKLVMPPSLARFVAENPMNESQSRRWDEVVEAKRREADARRRHRRLA